MREAENRIKLGGTLLCEGFAILTAILLWAEGEPTGLALAFGTVLLAALPLLMEKLLRCKISLPVYIFALAYAVGPMLGHCWKLYYTVPGWDKLLHISGGIMFAILGAFLFDLLASHEKYPGAKLFFSFCFSVTVAVLWEFAEFGADALLGMDMQNDTVIHGITSYLLGESLGTTGSITDIRSVVVNGTPLPVNGYLDIGLLDTMLDMLLETAGAMVTCVILWLDRGKHLMLRRTHTDVGPNSPEKRRKTA